MFERDDPQRPVILGLLEHPTPPWDQEALSVGGRQEPQRPAVVEVDGRRMVLTAEDEIVLRCGEASITLTRAGKVLIRGAYLLSRSSGANRIKGAVVEIN